MDHQVELVPDELLERTARTAGPLSVEAQVLRRLQSERARDRQVFKVGYYLVTAPMHMDAETELSLIALAEADEEE